MDGKRESYQPGWVFLDLNIFVIVGLAVPLVFDILPFFEFRKIMGVFPFMGGVVEAYVFLGLTADGNLSTGSGSTISYIVSASTTSFTWQAVVYVPLLLTISAFLLTIYVALVGR